MLRVTRSLTGLAVVLTIAGAASVEAQAVITNNTIRMGIGQYGDLNTGNVPQISGTEIVGLRLITAAGDYEATADGCTCEGWGVGVRSGGGPVTSWGGANSAVGGVTNLTPVSFNATPNSATSVVRLTSGPLLQITHTYRPSAITPYLYEVSVSITNRGATDIDDLLYRRVMDWDIAPTQFSEFVTLQGWGATNLIGSGSNGFLAAQPLSLIGNRNGCLRGSVGALCNANFTTSGSEDQGAFFDFSFGGLAAGASRDFTTFYGAAPTQDLLYQALSNVGAEVFSAAWCDPAARNLCRGVNGPAVFAYGFRGVGGLTPPPVLPPAVVPPVSSVPEPASLALMLTGLAFLGGAARRRSR